MPVKQQRRLARGLQPFRIKKRVLVLFSFDDFDVLHPHFPKLVGQKFDRAPHVRLVLGQRADAGDL